MLELTEWLQNMEIATAIRESALVYPIILSLHLTGMALFGGMILMTDLRLLGIAMTKRPVSAVVEGLRPWKHLGLTISHLVISQHGGEIEATSPGVGQGSTFTVRLPVLPTEPVTQLTIGESAPEHWEAHYPPRQLPEGARVTRLGPSPTGFMHIGGI